MALTSNEWERRRSEFNHDWLKNTYLRRLMGFLDRLNRAPDSPVIQEYLQNDFPLWSVKCDDAHWLALHLAEGLSPKQYFDVRPLALASDETKSWLPEVTHQVWLVKYRIEDAVTALTERIDMVNRMYHEISAELGHGQITERRLVEGLRSRFETYELLCRTLCDELSDIRKTIGTI